MPSATIPKAITPQQAADALKDKLGSDYKVTSRGSGSLTVKHAGTLAFATVRLNRDGNTTTFRVHGSGLIINRIINEFGIARTVTTALKDTFGPAHASGPRLPRRTSRREGVDDHVPPWSTSRDCLSRPGWRRRFTRPRRQFD